jgi:penicillin amidase
MRSLHTLLRLALGRRLPDTEGVVTVDGISGAVTVGRDRYGIPYVSATTDRDAWFGLGFCQGQDRAFQLELQRRAVRGTLAELLGPDLVGVDRLSRRIGFGRAAERILPRLREVDRVAVAAFAAGVDAARERGPVPHEMILLRGALTPATAADVVGVTLLQAFALAANWDAELARLEILVHDGPEALAALDTGYPEWHPVTVPPGREAGPALAALREDLSRFGDVVATGGASNNWALRGEHTATGRPIVANDPHLAPLLPPHWYLARVATPAWGLAGACLAGTPGFGVGHNGHVAWGVTAGLVDNTDLYVEEIGPDGASYRDGDGYAPAMVREETIAVRGRPPLTEVVLETERGPLVGAALDRTPHAISLQATWLDPERPGMLATAGAARTVADLHEEMRFWHGPTLNVVYADDAGDIAWTLIGEAPVRRAGHGTIPLPGWDPVTGWEPVGVPYDEMPHAVNPPGGKLATANNRPTAESAPYLGSDWLDGYRLARIVELLDGREGWTIADTLQAQRDTVSLLWADLSPHLLGVGERGDYVASYRLLARWDGDLAAGSAAATVFMTWAAEMEERIARRWAPHTVDTVLGRGHAPPQLIPFSIFGLRRGGHLARTLRDRPHPDTVDWDAEIAAALAAAERRLRSAFGNDTADWTWGEVRPLTLQHPAGVGSPLDRVFNLGPFPWSGDYTTVSQAGAPPLDPWGNPSAIASLRAAMDVGDWDNCRFSLPGGQSGNPLSPHYSDQVDPWMSGAGVPLPWTAEAIREAIVTRLFLLPPEE